MKSNNFEILCCIFLGHHISMYKYSRRYRSNSSFSNLVFGQRSSPRKWLVPFSWSVASALVEMFRLLVQSGWLVVLLWLMWVVRMASLLLSSWSCLLCSLGKSFKMIMMCWGRLTWLSVIIFIVNFLQVFSLVRFICLVVFTSFRNVFYVHWSLVLVWLLKCLNS